MSAQEKALTNNSFARYKFYKGLHFPWWDSMRTLPRLSHQARSTTEALRNRAAGFVRMARDCRDALISDELRRLAQEYLIYADELEASSVF